MSRRRVALASLLILTMSLWIYLPARRFGFIAFDDELYVTRNPMVLVGLTAGSAVRAFTSFRYAGNWHPLTWLSHMLDVQLFGLDGGRHHLTSLILHATNSVLLFWVLVLMTGALWPGAAVAALFACHPLHVESVAWISERKDLLSAGLMFLALAAYLGYLRRPGSGRRAALVLVFALSLMAKPMPVTLPLLLLMLDYWPLGRMRPQASGTAGPTLGGLFLEKTPLFVLSSISSAVTWYAQSHGGLISSLEEISFPRRLANAAVSSVRYLVKTIWPNGLAFHYPYPLSGWSGRLVAVSVLALLAITLLAWCRARREPWLAVGWFWYLVALAPVIGLVQVGTQAMADRYTYLPLVGIFMALAWSLAHLLRSRPVWRVTAVILAPAVILALTVAARAQVGFWRDSRSLFSHALEVTSGDWLTQNNLAVVLEREGDLEGALAHYRAALRWKPDYPLAHNNVGNLLFARGRTEEAVLHLKEALRLNPAYASPHANLCRIFLEQGRLDEALEQCRRAVELKPEHPQGFTNLGVILFRRGDLDGAVKAFTEATRLDPALADAHFNLGLALEKLGLKERALTEYRAAMRLKVAAP